MARSFESQTGLNNSGAEVIISKEALGPIPENPSNVSENDIKALKEYYKNHQDQFPSDKYIDVRDWENWRNISIQYNEDNKKWKVSYRSFFKGEEVIQEFDSEKEAQKELDKLQDYNKKIALDLIIEARNFALGLDVDTPWVDVVDISSSEAATSTTESNSEVESLQSELSRLITEAANKLKVEQDQRIDTEYIGLDREKIERFKENSSKAIQDYQKFASEHSSPFDNSNTQIQERYRQLEKMAWNSLYNLANALDGEIATLPTDRDIQLSHPGEVDTKQYLESRGYEFNEDGDITHIMDKGVKIELNRSIKTDYLIKSKRPSHIVYDKSISLDSDGDSHGYLVRGLNKHTPEFVLGVLDKDHLESVIVDETKENSSKTELGPNNITSQENIRQQDEIKPVFEVINDPDIKRYYEELESIDIADKLSALRLAYARAEEAWNRDPKNVDLENAFEQARDAYNYELERVLKLQVAQGQEANIHELFKNEVISLREQRITESKELQSALEKKFNPLKEKFVKFVIKHKKLMGRVNLGLGIAGGALALTGVGIPLAGGLAVARRMVSATLLGVSTGEGIRSLGEDADIKLGKLKWQSVIPKIVKESINSSNEEIKQVSEDVLKERLGTLEAYYRLNGGKFTNDDQHKAYERVLIELGNRVKVNTIGNYQNENASNVEVQQDIIQDSVVEQDNQDTNSTEQFNSRESRYYVSEMLNTISVKRINDLDKFRRNRRNATIAGLGVGLLVGGAVHILDEVNKPESANLTDGADTTGGATPDTQGPGAGPGGAEAPEADTNITPETTPPPATTGDIAEQALRQAAAEQAQELARDVSSLDSGETIWGEVAKQLGENATDAQIQQAVENLLQSEVGRNSIYELAQGTEGGRALLAQWSIDNAGEMAELSKEQLYEISRYLASGELKGITELSLDNLTPFEAVEPPQVDAPTPVAEAPISTEVSPIAGTEFTESLSKALGATNLTETQLQEIIASFATSEQGSVDLYNQIISNTEGARFLSGFGVNSASDFANLRPDELYEIVQTVGVENLDKLPSFELNEIIISKFEDAPDTVELARGTRPLDVVQRYIAGEVGNLPYDSNLGKQVLDTYVQTDAGKQWLYDAIVSNPNPNNQNVQLFREYLRFKDIKSPEEFVVKFNWSDFSGNKNIPTSGFWNQIRLPNGGARLQPLSTFLQPGQMIGIKESIRQVLTKQ